MRQAEFIKLYAKRNDYTNQDAAIIVRDFVETLRELILKGESVTFRGFGTFEVREHKGRTGYSVNSGEVKEFPSYVVPKFIPSEKLRIETKKKCSPKS